jgi:hypothetical protein
MVEVECERMHADAHNYPYENEQRGHPAAEEKRQAACPRRATLSSS